MHKKSLALQNFTKIMQNMIQNRKMMETKCDTMDDYISFWLFFVMQVIQQFEDLKRTLRFALFLS